MNAIRPAIETLNALRGGKTMDELAVQIHDAVSAVETFGKAGKVTLEITIAPFGTKGVSGAYAITGEISTKLPKPDPEVTLMFGDDDGNLSPNQTRQRDLGLSIAGNTKDGTND
jgi:hypothetical protein